MRGTADRSRHTLPLRNQPADVGIDPRLGLLQLANDLGLDLRDRRIGGIFLGLWISLGSRRRSEP
jgi:hypothetical protein